MREQSIFFEQGVGDKRIVVLKTYDQKLARAAFEQMTPEALESLSMTLELEKNFEISVIPSSGSEEFADFLWGAVEDGAREDWDSFSYFIVREEYPHHTVAAYVSSDWPSAEAFAKNLLGLSASAR